MTGNTSGLKASAVRAAQRIYRRRVHPSQVVSPELAQVMCRVSRDIGRQVGVLIDRRGQPDHVIIGDANRLWLPDIGRLRAGIGRLRGLRLVHTHLNQEPLTSDDLTDLALLRLDMVVALTMTSDGAPARAHCGHLLPDATTSDPWMVLDPTPVHDLTLDPLELVRALEAQFARLTGPRDAAGGKDRAVVVHVSTRRSKRGEEACLSELKELCRTAGVVMVDSVVQRRAQTDPRYVIGRGKLEQVLLRANQLGAELLIFDPDLSPAQARAISDATELKVIDRSMLILDIFAQHAKSQGGKLQVELAQLRYTLPRLVAKNTMMSRLTGGIGGRGPGETKLEVNRRRARDRIARLSRQLESLSQQRSRRRELRRSRKVPVVSLVGYTNAGKTTLLNAMTNSQAEVADKLFATLNPLSRRLRFPRDRELILTDTVGFIHDLPQELVHAFSATLEELREADLLVHVVDASDAQYESQMEAVRRIIGELGLAEIPLLPVFNKADRLLAEDLSSRCRGHDAICLSALDQKSTVPLLEAIEQHLWRQGRSAAGAR